MDDATARQPRTHTPFRGDFQQVPAFGSGPGRDRRLESTPSSETLTLGREVWDGFPLVPLRTVAPRAALSWVGHATRIARAR